MADAPKKAPYGDVEYADPGYQKDGKKRYPIDTAEHAKAAWDYINKHQDAAAYTSEQLAEVKSKIEAACKKFGIQTDDAKKPDAPAKPAANKAPAKAPAKKPAMSGTKSAPTDGAEAPEDAAHTGTSTGHASNEQTRKEPKVKTLEELRARLAEVEARMIEMGEETRDAELDEAGQTEWDALTDEAAKVRKSIENIEARAEALKGLAVSTPGTRETTTPKAPNFRKSQDNIYDIQAIRMDAVSPEDFANRLRDNAMRAIETAKYALPKDVKATQEDAQTYASNLLENVDTEDGMLAKRMLLTGSSDYERAFGKVVRYGSDAMCTNEERQALFRAQALGSDGSGGYAVPFQLDPTVILTNAGVVNPIRQLARVEQIVGKQWQGVTSAGVTVVRGAEGDTAPDNTFSLDQPVVSTNRVQGFVPFNIEIDLAWNALRTEITTLLVDGKAREENSFITGDGVTGTQPGGVIGSLSGNTVTAGGVAQFSANDVYNLHAALDDRWEPNASFLAHKGIYNRIRQFDTAGGAQLWAQIGQGRPGELLGYSAAYASAMANALTTGSKVLLFGDFKQFLIVDRIGMNVELIPHLFDTSNGRPTGQRGVYAIWMNNSTILVDSAFKLLVTG